MDVSARTDCAIDDDAANPTPDGEQKKMPPISTIAKVAQKHKGLLQEHPKTKYLRRGKNNGATREELGRARKGECKRETATIMMMKWYYNLILQVQWVPILPPAMPKKKKRR